MNQPDEALLRIGQAIKRYYQQVDAQDLTEADFKQWKLYQCIGTTI